MDDHESLTALAVSATLHCLTGCAIGEILGMLIGTGLGWSNWPTVALSVVLAFFFGYLLTSLPLLRAGEPLADRARQGPRGRARDGHPRRAADPAGGDARGARGQ